MSTLAPADPDWTFYRSELVTMDIASDLLTQIRSDCTWDALERTLHVLDGLSAKAGLQYYDECLSKAILYAQLAYDACVDSYALLLERDKIVTRKNAPGTQQEFENDLFPAAYNRRMIVKATLRDEQWARSVGALD